MITIGIDASRAFAKSRSGIGEYARELIGALISNNYLFNNRRIILFVRPGQDVNHFSRKLPSNWNFPHNSFFPDFLESVRAYFNGSLLKGGCSF